VAEKGSNWIIWLEECGMENRRFVGSKNANLGEMLRRGLPVPAGFAITTEMYTEYMAQTGIGMEIERYLDKFPGGPKTPKDYKEISKFVIDIILLKGIPEEMQHAISSAYSELSKKCFTIEIPVAVRSSSISEDLPTASFAGQYESFLNIKGKDVLFDKVMRCWASMFSARSIFYHINKNLPILSSSMSVGVQRMVMASSSGVCFTAHPGLGDDTKILLEGSWGVGESVVQGIVIPDRFVIDKETLRIEEKEINRKLKQIVIRPTGTEEQDIPEDKQTLPCLSDEEAVKIAEFGKAVENLFGIPLDIEWTLDEASPSLKNIFLVQARPITKLVKKKDGIERILDMMLSR